METWQKQKEDLEGKKKKRGCVGVKQWANMQTLKCMNTPFYCPLCK